MQVTSSGSDELQPVHLGISVVQPIEWIDLNAINPHFEMKVRASDVSGRANLANYLSSLNLLANSDAEFILVGVNGINSPATLPGAAAKISKG